MRKIFVSALLLFVVTLNAQVVFKLPFTPETGGKSLSKADFDVYTLNSEYSPYMVALLQDKKKIQYALITSQFKLVDSFRNVAVPASTIYGSDAESLGGLINEKVCYHIMKDEGSKSWFKKKNVVVAAEKIDFNNHTTSIENIYELTDEEVLASAYPYQNQLYLIVAQKQGSQFKIIRIDSTLQRTSQTININTSSLLEGKETLADYLSGVSVIYGNRDNPSDKYLPATKLYPRGDSIIITFDKNKMPSTVLSIDFKTGTSTTKTISYADFCGYTDKKVNAHMASVYYNNLLFIVNVCKKKVELAVIDPATGDTKKKMEINSGDNLNKLANGTVTRSTVMKGKRGEDIYLESADELINAFLSSPLALKVEANEKGQYVINPIAQKQATYTMRVPLPMLGGSSTSSNGMITTTASLSANIGFKMKLADSYEITSFKTMMDPSSFERIKNNPKPFAFEKIKDRYFMEEKIPESLSVLFLRGDYYFGFFDEESQRYTIKKVR